MTAAELAMPWPALDVHERSWRLVLRCGPHEAALLGTEVLDVVAALELDREPQRLVHAAIEHRSHGRRAALPWADLMDGALGLTSRAAAPGELSVGAALDAFGVELVRCEYAPIEDPSPRVRQLESGPESGPLRSLFRQSVNAPK